MWAFKLSNNYIPIFNYWKIKNFHVTGIATIIQPLQTQPELLIKK
jgi:hypothetical protein